MKFLACLIVEVSDCLLKDIEQTSDGIMSDFKECIEETFKGEGIQGFSIKCTVTKIREDLE